MKKTLILIAISSLMMGRFAGQTISKQEAAILLQRVMVSLQKSDVNSFVSLWHLDNETNFYDQTVFDRSQVVKEFDELREFLHVPLEKAMVFDQIEVAEMTPVFKAKYKVKAWFKIADSQYIAYSFLVDYVQGQWMFRWHGETTTSENPPKGI